MYSMVLMAALTTGVDMPDLGRRGGGCCGCRGGRGGGWGGGYGGCYGGWGGGCYGGYARGGWGGCGGGWGGGCGGGWGGGCGGGWGGGCGGGRGGYGGYSWGGVPSVGGYAYSPIMSSSGMPVLASNTNMVNPGTQSFFYNPGTANPGNQATITVHLPADANLTIDGQPTQSTSGTRTFLSPPLQQGKTYTYTLRAEVNRDGRKMDVKKNIDVQAGRRTEVNLDFSGANREEPQPNRDEEAAPPVPRRPLPRE